MVNATSSMQRNNLSHALGGQDDLEDYASVKALVDGKIDRFSASKFIRSERLSRNTSSMFAPALRGTSPASFAEGSRNDPTWTFAQRHVCQQIRGVYRCGAVPRNEKVVRVYTDEARKQS